MNDRMSLKIQLSLFSALLVAELLSAVMFGLRTELILFIVVIAAALSGIVAVTGQLVRRPEEIETVSMRRSRAMRDDLLKERFREYGIDGEFLSGRNAKTDGADPEPAFREAGKTMSGVSLEETIRVHAGRYGGIAAFLVKMEAIDEAACEKIMKDAGFEGVSREDILRRMRLMASVEGEACIKVCQRSLEEAMDAFSSDRASFDDYIRRSMSSGQSGMDMDEDAEAGFSVQLDTASLSKAGGTMPQDFSHDPRSVIDRLKQKGRPS
ncbi:MAG: hypothetical protein HGB20_07265 [Chlorobiaceae bacterium]|nr:hypothetical protein [Chlorobiaceae bacterium]